MAGYTRQSSALIMAGNEVTASPLNTEFNALQTAFSAVSGHTHDASTGNGPKINLTTSVVSTLPIANGGTSATTQGQAQINLGYTAADVLSKLVTVDGFGSGLDSDYVDGFDVEELVQVDFNQVITSVKTVTLGTATTAGTYQAFKPADYGVGKPGLFIDKLSTATGWEIGLWDTATSTGTINFLSSILTHNSIPVVTTTGTQTLTNKTFTDDVTTFQDSSDNTKKMQFDLSDISTATTRTFRFPNHSDKLVSETANQDLSNKQLVDSSVSFVDNADNTKALKFELSGITSGTTKTLTIPNNSGTIVTNNAQQTLENKTFTDTSTFFQNNANNTRILKFDLTGISNSTTRTVDFPNASGTVVLADYAQTLTNKTFTDDVTTFQDSSDNTKKMQFELSGITTATTRTLTVPDADTTLYARSNILGAVSLSGGIPTGAIIESGSNANGNYVKYANGTMICTQVQSNTADAWTTAAGSLFISSIYTWTFPATFATSFPVLTGAVIRNAAQATGIAFASQSTTAATWYGWCSSSAAAATQKTTTLVAIGTWF